MSLYKRLVKSDNPHNPTLSVPLPLTAPSPSPSPSSPSPSSTPSSSPPPPPPPPPPPTPSSTSQPQTTPKLTSSPQSEPTVSTPSLQPTTTSTTTSLVIPSTSTSFSPLDTPTSASPTSATLRLSAESIEPQTTFFATFTGTQALATLSDSSEPSETPTQQSSHAFFANKAAVAGTFSVVSLVILALFVAAALMLMKKRNKWEKDDIAYFEKYSQQDTGAGPPGDATSEGHESHMMEAMTPAPIDAYPDRQIHYGTIDSQHINQDDYPVHYPSGIVGYPPQDPSYQDHPPFNSTFSPFSDPHPALAPPVSFRTPATRGSGYNQSIDSFYGATGADDSSVNAL